MSKEGTNNTSDKQPTTTEIVTKPKKPLQKKFIKTTELAEMIGLEPRVLRKWCKENKIKNFKMGARGHYYIKLEDAKKVFDLQDEIKEEVKKYDEVQKPAEPQKPAEIQIPKPKPKETEIKEKPKEVKEEKKTWSWWDWLNQEII